MDWIVLDSHQLIVILCGLFYSILCVFSIVTGLIYMSGRKKLNPIELSDKFVSKLDSIERLEKFTIKMGFVTFMVGIIQGITAFSIFRGHSVILYGIALGFTIFSIGSVLFKLKEKVNSFSFIKLIFYVSILIVLLLNSTRTLFMIVLQ